MQSSQPNPSQAVAVPRSRSGALLQWLQEPLGSVIASSVAVIGSFGLVISGSWFIHLALN